MSNEAAFYDTKKLMEMSDEKLYAIDRSMKGQIESRRKRGEDTRAQEVEYCYLRREIDRRTARKNFQKKFEEQRLKKKQKEVGGKIDNRPGRPMSPRYRERIAR